MPSSTRRETTARKETYENLLRKLRAFKAREESAEVLKSIAESTLYAYPYEDEQALPSADEVGDFIISLLPAASTVFDKDYFLGPIFPTKLLKEVCDFYGCLRLSEEARESVLPATRRDNTAMYHVRLANVFSRETINRAVQLYRTFRAEHDSKWLEPAVASSFPNGSQEEERGNDEEEKEVQADEPNGRRVENKGRLPARQDFDSHRKAASVSAHFRDCRFRGELEESIHRTIRDYNICALQYELTLKQKATFFVNVFDGPAKDFFCDNCNESMSFETLRLIMIKEYDNDPRQLAVQSELENITLEKVMKEDEITDFGRGLKRLVDKINNLNPQCPEEFRTEKHKIIFLRSAVMKQDWAKNAISQITTSKYSFNRFVTALREQLQLAEERGDLSKESSVTGTHHQYPVPLYGRPPSQLSRKKNSNRKQTSTRTSKFLMKNPIGKDGKRMLCDRCGSDSHFKRNCPPDALRQRVRGQIQKGIPSMNIMADLVNLLEDEAEYNYDEGQEDKDDIQKMALFDKLTGHVNEGEAKDQDVENALEEADAASAIDHISLGMSPEVIGFSVPDESGEDQIEVVPHFQ